MNILVGNNIPVILEDSGKRPRSPARQRTSLKDRRRGRSDSEDGAREDVVVHLTGKTAPRRRLTY